MVLEEMKNIIRYVIELDIEYLESFLGYDGDKVLRVTTRSKHALELMEAYLDNLDLEYKSEFIVYDASYKLFVGVGDPSVFKLKKT
ncbi:MAG: hypothetical protein KAR81_02150 [Sulfurimonas sp.]|nr:hypothetical protein [Sulfurimonas sp.]